MQRVLKELVRFSIILIVLVSNLAYLLQYIVVKDGCTGTDSGYFATMLICSEKWDYFFGIDFFVFSGVILFIWIFWQQTRYIRWLRGLCLLHLLVIRFLAIWLSSFVQVRPFITF